MIKMKLLFRWIVQDVFHIIETIFLDLWQRLSCNITIYRYWYLYYLISLSTWTFNNLCHVVNIYFQWKRMPEETSFRLKDEKHVSVEVEFMLWSSKFDLIALANVLGEVHLLLMFSNSKNKKRKFLHVYPKL